MDGIEACTQKWTLKKAESERGGVGGGAAVERGGGSEGGEKFRRGGQICKALELRGRASHLIRRRFYSPRRPNPDKLSAIREPPRPRSTLQPLPHLLILGAGAM